MEVAPRWCRPDARRVTDGFWIEIERSLSFYLFGIPHHSTAAPGVALELLCIRVICRSTVGRWGARAMKALIGGGGGGIIMREGQKNE